MNTTTHPDYLDDLRDAEGKPLFVSQEEFHRGMSRCADDVPKKAEYKKCKDCGADIPHNLARCKPCDNTLRAKRSSDDSAMAKLRRLAAKVEVTA